MKRLITSTTTNFQEINIHKVCARLYCCTSRRGMEELVKEVEGLQISKKSRQHRKHTTLQSNQPQVIQGEQKPAYPAEQLRSRQPLNRQKNVKETQSRTLPQTQQDVKQQTKQSGNQPQQSEGKQGKQRAQLVSSNAQADIGIPGRSKHRVHNMQTRSQTSKFSRDPKVYLIPVPEPSPAYIVQANQQSQRLSQARTLLVVLDLNGTLVRKTGTGGIVKRAAVAEFLKYVDSNHVLMIWSSARSHTVQERCLKLFTECGLPVPKLIWSRENFNLTPKHYESNVQVYKQLSWLWNDAQVQDAGWQKETVFEQSNTVLIDDSIEKARSEPYNLIKIEAFEAASKECNELSQMIEYLEELRWQSNVSAYIKKNPLVITPGRLAPAKETETMPTITSLEHHDLDGIKL